MGREGKWLGQIAVDVRETEGHVCGGMQNRLKELGPLESGERLSGLGAT